MTLTIELTAEQEARIDAAARREGIAPTAFLLKLVDAHLPPLSDDEEKARRAKVMEELVEQTERLGLYK